VTEIVKTLALALRLAALVLLTDIMRFQAIVLGLVGQAVALPSLTNRQDGPSNELKAYAVKEAFQISWRGYYEYAFPSDNLLPVTNTADNDRFVSLLRPQAQSIDHGG
jgi:hypothetical protein